MLTQNTSWKNVEKVIKILNERNLINKEKLTKIPTTKLASLIKSSGYYNQKARKIKEFIKFLNSNKQVTRENLLKIWGIGKETADSILLYAYNKPYFVIDNYTKKIFSKLNYCKKDISYDELQELIINNLPKDVNLYKEFHALLVEYGKTLE
ncbi:MAG: endonuclease [Nanoarchaeota archaeon]